MKRKPIFVNLSLFDGGASAEPAPQNAESVIQGETEGVPESTPRGENTGESTGNSSVQETEGGLDAGEREKGENTENSLKREYDDFVRAHKEIDEKRIQNLINRRFKEQKRLEEEVKRLNSRLDAANPIIARLSERYGIKEDEAQALTEAFLNDKSLFFGGKKENAPENCGGTESEKAESQKEKRDEKALLKELMPAFDLEREYANKDFSDLVNAGVSPEKAYKAAHFDELVSAAASLAFERAERETLSRLRERGARPAENGISRGSSFIIRNDVSRMTKKDREEAIKRSLMGETVTFGD